MQTTNYRNSVVKRESLNFGLSNLVHNLLYFMSYFKAQKLSKPNIDFGQNYTKSFYSICMLTVIYFYFISAKDYEINHDQIELHNTIGQGQFGDVHRGTYTFPVSAWNLQYNYL